MYPDIIIITTITITMAVSNTSTSTASQMALQSQHADQHADSVAQQPDPLFALIHSIAETEAFFGQLTAGDIENLEFSGRGAQWTDSPHIHFLHEHAKGRRIPSNLCEYEHGFLPGPCEYTNTPEVARHATLRYCARHVALWGKPMAVCARHSEMCRDRDTGKMEVVCDNCASSIRIEEMLGPKGQKGRHVFTHF